MTEVLFNGHAGRLEGRYHQSEKPGAPIALILHPHPQYGGTMNNKVVYSLFSCFQNLGFSVLRFNFRSVGRSQGEFEDGPGELSDATVALDWLQSVNPEARQCWIAGYSFGAWIGLQLLMRRPDINNFIAVSPPANEKDFGTLSDFRPDCSGRRRRNCQSAVGVDFGQASECSAQRAGGFCPD